MTYKISDASINIKIKITVETYIKVTNQISDASINIKIRITVETYKFWQNLVLCTIVDNSLHVYKFLQIMEECFRNYL